MKKTLKKTLAMVMSVIMCASFAACGDEDSSSNSSKSGDNLSSVQTEQSAESTKIEKVVAKTDSTKMNEGVEINDDELSEKISAFLEVISALEPTENSATDIPKGVYIDLEITVSGEKNTIYIAYPENNGVSYNGKYYVTENGEVKDFADYLISLFEKLGYWGN